MISLFGLGFIGKKLCELYPQDIVAEPRESIVPRFNEILYLRGTTSNYTIFEDASKDVRDNLLLFTETLRKLKTNDDFNLISSWFVYGQNNKSQLSYYEQCEYDNCKPKGFYSITKYTQEQLLESYCNTLEIRYKILRLSNIIGGDLKASSKKNAFEYMIGKIKNNEDIDLYYGDNYRNFLDVETCCKAIKFVMDNGKNKQIYNIGADQSYKVGDLIQYCIDKTKSKSKIRIIEVPKFHKQVQVENFWMNTDKLNRLGFDNKINIYEKLDKILV